MRGIYLSFVRAAIFALELTASVNGSLQKVADVLVAVSTLDELARSVALLVRIQTDELAVTMKDVVAELALKLVSALKRHDTIAMLQSGAPLSDILKHRGGELAVSVLKIGLSFVCKVE